MERYRNRERCRVGESMKAPRQDSLMPWQPRPSFSTPSGSHGMTRAAIIADDHDRNNLLRYEQ